MPLFADAVSLGVERGRTVIDYEISPEIDSEALNALFAEAWPDHRPRDFSIVLSQNLGHVCALADGVLVGFVNVA